MLLLQSCPVVRWDLAEASQSPIHRECFCYWPAPPTAFLTTMSQSPIHRECFCYPRYAPRRRGPAALGVAIPYSSGMLLLPLATAVGLLSPSSCRNPLFIGNAFATKPMASAWWMGGCYRVAIPYSSGMLLLPQCNPSWRTKQPARRNPLFIGNAFATGAGSQHHDVYPVLVAIPYSSGMLLLRGGDCETEGGRRQSQSPIHRECFCYRLRMVGVLSHEA